MASARAAMALTCFAYESAYSAAYLALNSVPSLINLSSSAILSMVWARVSSAAVLRP